MSNGGLARVADGGLLAPIGAGCLQDGCCCIDPNVTVPQKQADVNFLTRCRIQGYTPTYFNPCLACRTAPTPMVMWDGAFDRRVNPTTLAAKGQGQLAWQTGSNARLFFIVSAITWKLTGDPCKFGCMVWQLTLECDFSPEKYFWIGTKNTGDSEAGDYTFVSGLCGDLGRPTVTVEAY